MDAYRACPSQSRDEAGHAVLIKTKTFSLLRYACKLWRLQKKSIDVADVLEKTEMPGNHPFSRRKNVARVENILGHIFSNVSPYYVYVAMSPEIEVVQIMLKQQAIRGLIVGYLVTILQSGFAADFPPDQPPYLRQGFLMENNIGRMTCRWSAIGKEDPVDRRISLARLQKGGEPDGPFPEIDNHETNFSHARLERPRLPRALRPRDSAFSLGEPFFVG